MHTTGKAAGYFYVLLSAVCFAFAGVLIKSIDWNALSISGARSILAAGVLYVFLRAQGKRFTLNGPTALGVLINSVMLQTFMIANKLTTAANAIVLQFTMPVWLIIIMWAFMRERPRRAAVCACAAIMAGIACFFFDDLSPEGLIGNIVAVVIGETIGPLSLVGAVLVIGGATAYNVYNARHPRIPRM